MASAAGAAEQEPERRCGPVLRRLAARLQAGAAGQPLLPAQAAAVLVERVRQQLVLWERLSQELKSTKLKSLDFMWMGCSIEVSVARVCELGLISCSTV